MKTPSYNPPNSPSDVLLRAHSLGRCAVCRRGATWLLMQGQVEATDD